jgi:hypothetical protein
VFIALLAVVAMPAVARAQVHLQLLGGMTSAAGREPFIGGGIGARLSFIEIGVEAGRLNDVLPRGVLDALNELQREQGLPVQAIASVPATYAFASLRIIPGIGVVRPFVQGGFGMARLEPRVEVNVGGISLGDVFGLTSFAAQTEPMAVAAGGVRIGNKSHVEVGYRYVVIFSDFRGFNRNSGVLTYVNALYGAVGVGF